MTVNRREFLRHAGAWLGGAAVSAAFPSVSSALEGPAPVAAAAAAAASHLKGMIQRYAQRADDPWILMHAVRALGPGITVGDENAVNLLCARYLQEDRMGGRSYPYMPGAHEGHANAFLKTMLEAGVPLSRSFRLNGHTYQVGDLVEGAKARFRFEPKTANPDELAWSLIAFSKTVPADRDTWTNADGGRIRLSEVIRFGFDVLDAATSALRQAMHQGQMPTAKDKIHGFTCGGTHLIYALAACVGNGYRQDDFVKRLAAHLELLVWRLSADWSLLERFYSQQQPEQALKPHYALYGADAWLKFCGHAFEILSYAQSRRLFRPTPAQTQTIAQAGGLLVASVERVRQAGDLMEIRRDDPKLFRLLVGDVCHAYHGIHMVWGVNQALRRSGTAPVVIG